MTRALFALLALIAVSAVGRADDLVTRDGRPIKSVVVISGLSDEVSLVLAEPSVPVTVYRTSERSLAIPGFSIDARIDRLISSAVASRFNVAPTPSDLAGIDFGVWDPAAIRARILAMSKREDVDAYIIACRDERAIESGWFQTFSGLGLYHRNALFFRITDVFAAYRIAVVDARTGEIIKSREAGIETGLFESSLPRKRVDNTRWPSDDGPLPPDQIPQLRDDLYVLMDASVPWTLKELELTP